jgi:hypothetical protein
MREGVQHLDSSEGPITTSLFFSFPKLLSR